MEEGKKRSTSLYGFLLTSCRTKKHKSKSKKVNIKARRTAEGSKHYFPRVNSRALHGQEVLNGSDEGVILSVTVKETLMRWVPFKIINLVMSSTQQGPKEFQLGDRFPSFQTRTSRISRWGSFTSFQTDLRRALVHGC